MSSKAQEIIQDPKIEDNNILLGNCYYTRDETKALIKKLQTLIKSCNVATTPAPIVESLFDSVNDPNTLTIYVNTDEEFLDARAALKVEKDSLMALIDAMVDYYSERESLNIIFAKHTLRNHGDSYFRFTAQFAQQIAAKTQEFLKVKVIYDSNKELLGVFCRKSDFEISVTFFGNLLYNLERLGEVFAPYSIMPDTYVDFPSMLHFKIRKKVSEGMEVKMQKKPNGLKFILVKPQNNV